MQLFGDLAVAQARGHQAQDLALARTQGPRRVGQFHRRAPEFLDQAARHEGIQRRPPLSALRMAAPTSMSSRSLNT